MPWFRGTTTYQDPLGRFTFRHNSEWTRADLEDDRDGIIVGPDLEADPATYFAVWAAKLDETVEQADLPVLSEGFDNGLKALPDLVVDKSEDKNYNDIIKIERYIRFSEDGQTRQRRVWAMYATHWQLLVVFQGKDLEEFDYWEAMGNYCFASFELPQYLWFATDPELRPKKPGDDEPAVDPPSPSSE